jgi:glycosyltransferase involved in cell wall biosynthesis
MHMTQQPIRVLHVIGSLGLGGAQVCVKYIVENSPSDFEHFVYPLRSHPRDIPIKGTVLNLTYRNYDPRKFLALVRLCRTYKIDILHAHLPKPIAACLLATFFCKTKVVIHEHGPVLRKKAAFPGYRFLFRILKNRARTFIAVSQAVAEKLQTTFALSADQIQVVYNAVDPAVFDPEKYSRNEARQRLGIDKTAVVLGFIGRLTDQKGVDILIRTLPLVHGLSDNCLLLIAGEGPRRHYLEHLASELGVEKNVRFLGFCLNIPEIISTFDIGLVPSRHEPFGMVAVELMRMKIPIVTSGANGLKEFITDGKTGLITTANTPSETARCIIKLIGDSNLRKSMIESAYAHSEQFGVARYIEAICRIYAGIMKP